MPHRWWAASLGHGEVFGTEGGVGADLEHSELTCVGLFCGEVCLSGGKELHCAASPTAKQPLACRQTQEGRQMHTSRVSACAVQHPTVCAVVQSVPSLTCNAPAKLLLLRLPRCGRRAVSQRLQGRTMQWSDPDKQVGPDLLFSTQESLATASGFLQEVGAITASASGGEVHPAPHARTAESGVQGQARTV